MTGLASSVLILAGMGLALPVLVLLVLVLMTLLPRRVPVISSQTRPPVAVLVPAHNEELTIGKTLASIRRQLSSGDRLVVVADNCSDATALIAQQSGTEVAIRSDLALRGKGFALQHGVQFLAGTGALPIVIFVDADCQLDAGCIDRLALSSFQTGRPAQATYLMNAPRPAQKTASIVAFAWMVKDFVRPLGWRRLGLPCPLAGSGMAFPWEVLRTMNLAGADLAEDLKYGLDLALSGTFVQFCPDAVVRSDVAPAGTPSKAQRARWEHGVMETTLAYLPKLLARFCQVPGRHLLAVMLDLCVPPLALLALALGALLVVTLSIALVTGAIMPAVISIAECLLFLIAIILAWWRHGQDMVPLSWLVFAPVYALLKIPMYGRFLLSRQRDWVGGTREA